MLAVMHVEGRADKLARHDLSLCRSALHILAIARAWLALRCDFQALADDCDGTAVPAVPPFLLLPCSVGVVWYQRELWSTVP